MQKTFIPQKDQIQRTCYIVNADGKILGRLAARVSAILRGKHKVNFTPHLDSGDTVVVINAEKIKVTGNKLRDKIYRRYSGYPGGQKRLSLGALLAKKPEAVIKLAVNRMIPSGPLGYSIRRKLRVYAGDKHPHQAQKPVPLEI